MNNVILYTKIKSHIYGDKEVEFHIQDEFLELVTKYKWELTKSEFERSMFPIPYTVENGIKVRITEKMFGDKSLYLPIGDPRNLNRSNLIKVDRSKLISYAKNKKLREKRVSLGVYAVQRKHKKVWCARVLHSGKMYNLGSFETKLQAAEARDKFVLEKQGPLAVLNFPTDGVQSTL